MWLEIADIVAVGTTVIHWLLIGKVEMGFGDLPENIVCLEESELERFGFVASPDLK